MGHHAGQLSFIISGKNEAGIHVEEAAGERHGIDHVRVNDFDREWNFCVRVPHQVLAHSIHILVDNGIGNQLQAGLDLGGILFTHADLTLNGVPVPARHLAVADGVHVIFATVVLALGFLVFVFLLLVFFALIGIRRGLRLVLLRGGSLALVSRLCLRLISRLGRCWISRRACLLAAGLVLLLVVLRERRGR